MTPVLAFSPRPAGKVPVDTDHVRGVVPPAAANVCEYAAPMVPGGSGDVVVMDIAGATTIDSGWLSFDAPALSVT